MQNINRSDLTDILEGFVRTHFLENKREIIKRPSRRPKAPSIEDNDLGGKPSHYESTLTLKEVMGELKKPNVQRAVNTNLMDSGLAYVYLKYEKSVLYHLVRVDENALWNNISPFHISQSELNKDPRTDIYLNQIKCMHENDLEALASKEAKRSLDRFNNVNNLFLTVIAGVLALSVDQ